MSCRSCNGNDLRLILSLGSTPLANALLTREQLDEPEPRYPLDLVHCRNCSLVQITETVAPELLFREYVYFSSFSDTVLSNAKAVAESMTERLRLGTSSLVAEIASNDGYLLQFYKELKVPVLGIEPARNIASIARDQRGIPTIEEFFGEDLGYRLRHTGTRADVIHANNVLAHVPDLNGFVRGLACFLKDSGAAVIEVPYVKSMLDDLEFDTIYHEHLCYFSLTSLTNVLHRAGLEVFDVEQIPIHGGSLRVFARKMGSTTAGHAPAVTALLAEERRWRVAEDSVYQDFGTRVPLLREELTRTLRDLKAAGARIAAYGASAKGSTLLNYCGVDSALVDYVVDRNTYKQGRFSPGTHLPILAPEYLLSDRPDYVLLLTWNFAAEILAQQDAYRRAGGRFIVPVPDVRVV